MKKVINTNDAPKAIGAYSQGIAINNFVFTSGQLPINPKTGEMVEPKIEAQTKQCMENIKSILKEGNMTLDDAIKVTIFISDMNNFSNVNKVYETYFKGQYPARCCFEVGRLPKDALVEIEVIASK